MPRGRPGTGMSPRRKLEPALITEIVRASSLLTNRSGAPGPAGACCGGDTRNTRGKTVYVNTSSPSVGYVAWTFVLSGLFLCASALLGPAPVGAWFAYVPLTPPV